ncbi:MAG: NAD(P)H-hydrate dehydratase [Candidatus Thorarchaeota archaeon]
MQKAPMTTQEMRVLELNSEYLGVTHSMLMQNAGREVARVVTSNEKVKGKRIVILCGLGGNGGDGMVAARYLHEEGAAVEVYLLGSENDISNRETIINWGILKNLQEISRGVLKTESSVRKTKSIIDADIIIDGMMGFGLKSRLREPIISGVEMFNKSTAKKYAIDVPTGINSDTGEIHGKAVNADVTIALHGPKKGTLAVKELVGKTKIVSIGIPAEASTICGPGDLSYFVQPRKSTARKGDFGRILVVGGSDVYSGAPALAGLAALRTGADLVSIIAPEPVVAAVRSYSPNLMVSSLGTRVLMQESVDSIIEAAASQDVVALGPGLGLDHETVLAVRAIVSELVQMSKPIIMDADGLKALAGSEQCLNPDFSVLTPHWGELSILMEKNIGVSSDMANRISMALETAKKYDSVILLKGPIDIVAHPDGRHKLNRTGVPAMSVGGTGDVLSGIVAALLARGHGAFKAASAAAFVSGSAGELAFNDLGDHIMATDCIDRIPAAMSSRH